MDKKRRNYAKANFNARKKRDRRKNRRVSPVYLAGIVFVCILCAFLCTSSTSVNQGKNLVVILKAESHDMLQGQDLPEYHAVATCNGDVDTYLEKDNDYKVKDLLEELNHGIGYEIQCDADGSEEGKFDISIQLKSELLTPMYSNWFGKVSIITEDGELLVKNRIGEWEGNRFKRWDKGYVKSEFITYHGDTYYLNKDGKKQIGWKDIQGTRYHFTDEGVMSKGWLKTKDNTYYFEADGELHVGWLRLDGEEYYFDEDGKMLTGEQQIGIASCVFGKDGKLQSREGGVDPNKPMIALTFDDGPGPRTMELLEVLEKYNARATFFMLGQNVKIYPDTVKKMAEIHCELGNHSYDHKDLSASTVKEIKSQMKKTNEAVKEATGGQQITVMRPPYGAIDNDVKKNVGMPMILWSIDTLDWKTRKVKSTIKAVMDEVEDGDIILLHDIHTETIDATIKLIPMLIEEGYQLVTVSEMAEAKGIRMEDGGNYGRFTEIR